MKIPGRRGRAPGPVQIQSGRSDGPWYRAPTRLTEGRGTWLETPDFRRNENLVTTRDHYISVMYQGEYFSCESLDEVD